MSRYSGEFEMDDDDVAVKLLLDAKKEVSLVSSSEVIRSCRCRRFCWSGRRRDRQAEVMRVIELSLSYSWVPQL